MRRRAWALLFVFVAAAIALAFVACTSDPGGAPGDGDGGPDAAVETGRTDSGGEGGTTGGSGEIVVLALSDWRGQVDPVIEADDAGIPRPYGGLPALTTYFAQDRDAAANTLVVSAGDAFGSSPLVSSATDDQLAAQGLDLLGMTAQALGPHDFDRGAEKLAALLELGAFRATATNMSNVAQVLGPRPVTPFLLFDVAGGGARLKVAILGLTNFDLTGVFGDDLSELQFPNNLNGVTTKDPIQAANANAHDARLVGADVVIALAHFGAGVDVAGAPSGPLIDLATQLNGVDLLVGGQTDRAFTAKLGGLTVVQNRNKGRTYARIKITVVDGAVTVATPELVLAPLAYDVVRPPNCDAGTCSCILTPPCPATYTCDAVSGYCTKPTVTPDPKATALVEKARGDVPALLDTAIAVASDAFPRDGSELSQETALGDLVADAMLDRYKAQIALVQGSRLRTALPSPFDPGDPNLSRKNPPFDLVVGDLQLAFPLGDSAVVRTLPGEVIWQALETSVRGAPSADPAFLQVAGITVKYSVAPDAGSRVQSVVTSDGQPVPRDLTPYTVVLLDATNAGADGYDKVLAEQVPTPSRELVTDIMTSYLKTNTPVKPVTAFTRIVKVP